MCICKLWYINYNIYHVKQRKIKRGQKNNNLYDIYVRERMVKKRFQGRNAKIKMFPAYIYAKQALLLSGDGEGIFFVHLKKKIHAEILFLSFYLLKEKR